MMIFFNGIESFDVRNLVGRNKLIPAVEEETGINVGLSIVGS